MKNTVFIHTNAKQMVGAIVGRHSLKRTSADPDSFDVRIASREDFSFFDAFEGRKFLRAGTWRAWENADLQSFTPVRFTPPKLMGYQGRAIVIDPDVFAVGDVNELFRRDMEGKAILARPRPGHVNARQLSLSRIILATSLKAGIFLPQKAFHWPGVFRVSGRVVSSLAILGPAVPSP